MKHSVWAAAAALPLLAAGLAAPAYADDLTVTASENAVVTVGSNGQTTYVVDEGESVTLRFEIVATREGNAKDEPVVPDCNPANGTTASVSFTSSSPALTAPGAATVVSTCGSEFSAVFTANEVATDTSVNVNPGVTDSGRGDSYTTPNVKVLVRDVPAPAPANTAPVVTVTGVDSASYEIGSEPTPGCSVEDEAEDASATPVITGTLEHGLGTLTATCSYSDGEFSDSDSVSWTIVDTGDPTITGSVTSGTAGSNGWYTSPVTVSFECADEGGSGIADGGCTAPTTLSEDGADQSVTGTATDWAGNEASDTVAGIDIDATVPDLVVTAGPAAGASYFYGEVPAEGTCAVSDATSGPASASCGASGYSTAVGTHTITFTGADLAGNQARESVVYTVKPLTTRGFFAPIDGGGVLNTVKAGSTIPLKFEVFGSTERTSTSDVSRLSATTFTCGTSAPEDLVEQTVQGSTALRYDATAGQFVQTWQTPRSGAGQCYRVTMHLADGTTKISADVKLK